MKISKLSLDLKTINWPTIISLISLILNLCSCTPEYIEPLPTEEKTVGVFNIVELNGAYEEQFLTIFVEDLTLLDSEDVGNLVQDGDKLTFRLFQPHYLDYTIHTTWGDWGFMGSVNDDRLPEYSEYGQDISFIVSSYMGRDGLPVYEIEVRIGADYDSNKYYGTFELVKRITPTEYRELF